MRRTWLFCALIGLCPLLGLVAWLATPAKADKAAADNNTPVSKKLAITQVVLFNTGLGYFQREGQVDGDARIDLAIPTTDVNDLLKTLLIDNAGKPTAISYDGSEPIESKLRSFGVDLTSNPTLGQLLNQARGEKVEISLEGTGGGAATAMTGTIVGMEAQFENQTREVHHLNVMCTDGVRRVPLERVQRVRFLDPVLEDEFRRALSVLSAGGSDVRRLVSVRLHGEGKRKVKMGHVAETPIWKASYRLVLDGKDTKPSLQGYAIVENTTDEDWKDVRVILVSGRPITFRMDLAQQLFMPRPTAQSEVFASLRPPTYESAIPGAAGSGQAVPGAEQFRGQVGVGFGGGGFQGGMQLGGLQGMNTNFHGNVNLGAGGGMLGTMPGMTGASQPLTGPGGQFNRYQPMPGTIGKPRLTYEELMRRRNEMLAKRKQEKWQARDAGTVLANLGENIDDVVSNADRIGEGFRLSIEPRVSLGRQKSGMLTTLQSAVDLKRISVYAPAVHPRFPLRAVRLKNSTGQHLQQGPVAVYDGGDYVGDCQLPDLQPGQERLLSYAMDLGVEVRPEQKSWTDGITSMNIQQGVLVLHHRQHRKTTYQLFNRSKRERTVLVEHPLSATWELTKEGEQPVEKSRKQYRFEWKIEQGKTVRKEVVESQSSNTQQGLFEMSDELLKKVMNHPKGSAAVKEVLGKLLVASNKLTGLTDQAMKAEQALSEAKKELERITATLGKLPQGSGAHKTYLKKFEDADALVDKLKAQSKEKSAALLLTVKEHKSMVSKLNAK